MKRKQQGVTLLELILVIALMAFVTLLGFQSKQLEMDQRRAKEVGGQLFTYNNAVRNWFTNNMDPSNLTQTRVGTTWLKPNSCGGSSGRTEGYLPCSFPDATAAKPTPYGRLVLTTVLTRTYTASEGAQFRAVTTTTPFTLSSFRNPSVVRSDLAGLAALTAASGGMIMDTPMPATSDASFTSGIGTGIITMEASSQSELDAWLRTDGGNTMSNNLRFDESRNRLLRQIRGTSRVQAIAGEVLYLGNASGNFNNFPAAPLANERVVVDANTRIYGQLRTNGAITALSGNISAQAGSVSASIDVSAGRDVTAVRDVTARRNVTATSNVTAGGNVQAGVNVQAGLDVRANRDLIGNRFIDRNNTAYIVDPHSTSRLETVGVRTLQSYDNGTLNMRGNTIDIRSKAAGIANLTGRVNVNSLNVVKNGREIPLSRLLPNFVHMNSYVGGNSFWIPKPSCPGGTPKVIVTPQSIPTNTIPPASGYSASYMGQSNFRAVNSGSNWIIQVSTASGRGFDSRAVASTYCMY